MARPLTTRQPGPNRQSPPASSSAASSANAARVRQLEQTVGDPFFALFGFCLRVGMVPGGYGGRGYLWPTL